MRTGITTLPLHPGKAPEWLLKRQKPLAREIINLIVDEYGPSEFVRRVSDPYWFQALSCVLAFDWHSSGTTPVTTAVLKWAVIPEEHGFAIAGGKGKTSLKTPQDIENFGKTLSLPDSKIDKLTYTSKITAKVDNTAIQSGYSLYHHTLFFTEKGEWSVVQQGLDPATRTARRYHWLDENVESFVEEPHNGICCDVVKKSCLDMTAKESYESRKVAVDLIKDGPNHLRKYFLPSGQTTLENFSGNIITHLKLPDHAQVNWKALDLAYDQDPRDFEGLLGIRGIGPSTIRGLAFVSEVVYGARPSFRDPVKFSYAFGGKDGVPRPVDRRAMDESVEFLRGIIAQARIGKTEQLRCFKRLRASVPMDMEINATGNHASL